MKTFTLNRLRVLFAFLGLATLAFSFTINASGASISGTVSYSGTRTGMVYVTATDNPTNLVLNAANSGMEVPNSAILSPTRLLTIEFWIKASLWPGTYLPLLGKGVHDNGNLRTYYMESLGTGLQFTTGSGSDFVAPTANGVLVAGQWRHIACVMDRNVGYVAFYTNGILASSNYNANLIKNAYVGTQSLNIGFGSGHPNTFNGSMDEVRVWNKVRNGTEIFADMNRRLSGLESGLVGYWNFDQGPSDLTTNANNGTLRGSATIASSDLTLPGTNYITSLTLGGRGNYPYLLTNLIVSRYHVSAFLDTNGNATANLGEPIGYFPGNLLLVTNAMSNVDLLLNPRTLYGTVSCSGSVTGIVYITATASNAAFTTTVPNPGPFSITNLGLAPYTLTAFLDSNTNGVRDCLLDPWASFPANPVIFYDDDISNVVMTLSFPDSDNDGLIDCLELQYGLNPANNFDSTTTPLNDQLTYLQKFQYGLNVFTNDTDGDGLKDYDELFLYYSNPLAFSTLGDGVSDGVKVATGKALTFKGEKYYYDRNDRLVGAEYAKGLSLGYSYDGNGNILHQTYLGLDANTNGLPDLYEFLNGLTNNPSAYTDADGDGWSDFQEWRAGSNPANAVNTPDVMGVVGTNLVSMTWPFTPSNFVMAVGQLDGIGPEEIVIGADGDPGTTTNFCLLLSQTTSGWSTQKVVVGSVGITSLAIGQVSSNVGPAIYFGNRTASGTGTVWQAATISNTWDVSSLSLGSTGQVAFVLGLQSTNELLVSIATTNVPGGSLSGLSYITNWTLRSLDTNISHRGLGVVQQLGLASDQAIRLLDSSGISVGGLGLPANAVFNAQFQSWYFTITQALSWPAAEALAQTYGGHLATINSVAERDWVTNQFKPLGISTMWIGLNDVATEGSYAWSSGAPFSFTTNWAAGEPNNVGSSGVNADYGLLNLNTGRFEDDNLSTLPGAIVQVVGSVQASYGVIAEPPAANRQNWRGVSLTVGEMRTEFTNVTSLLYAFLDDKNGDQAIGLEDAFILAEYSLPYANTASLFTNTLDNQPASPNYALASVNYLSAFQEVAFTGEPNGGIYSWRATNASGPLERTLFSAQFQGKAWHQMEGHKGLVAGEALVGLWVDPTNPSACNLAYFPPASELYAPPVIAQTAPDTRILPAPNSGNAYSEVALRLWDAEGNSCIPLLQFSTNGGATWFAATLHQINGQPHSPALKVGASPGGLSHTLLWNSHADLPGYVGSVSLRALATDITLTGDWSPTVTYQLNDTTDLRVTQSDSPDPAVTGASLTYTITVTNAGPSTGFASAVTDILPANASFVSASASKGSYNQSGGTVSFTVGELTNSETAILTVSVSPSTAGTITNTVLLTTTSMDVDLANNTIMEATTVNSSEQLAVTPPTLDIGSGWVGGAAQGLFTLTNTGASPVSGIATVESPFSIVGGGYFNVPASGASSVTVSFNPVITGQQSAQVIFTSNGGNRTNTVTGLGIQPAVAEFTATPTNGVAPLAVTFTDLSSGSISNRLWLFGDGTSLLTTNTTVLHIYAGEGVFTISLAIEGLGGVLTNTKPDYVTVLVYPPGDVNGDLHVTGADSLLINQVLYELRATNHAVFGVAGYKNGDVNQDGSVTGGDPLLINQVMIGLRPFVVSKALPTERTNTEPRQITIYGIGFPTNDITGAIIGSPVGLTLSGVTVISPEKIRATVPAGGGIGTGTVQVISVNTNNVISTGTFINR